MTMKTYLSVSLKPAVPPPLKVVCGGRRTVWTNSFLLGFTVATSFQRGIILIVVLY